MPCTHPYPAHRALADVEAMVKIMLKTGLVNLLSSLQVRSPSQQLGAWATQKNTHNRVTQLLTSLGKRITNAQAKRLNELGLSYEALQDLRSSTKDRDGFYKAIQESGVNSKPLCEKLNAIVKPQRSLACDNIPGYTLSVPSVLRQLPSAPQPTGFPQSHHFYRRFRLVESQVASALT